jgi:hypothetical protein
MCADGGGIFLWKARNYVLNSTAPQFNTHYRVNLKYHTDTQQIFVCFNLESALFFIVEIISILRVIRGYRNFIMTAKISLSETGLGSRQGQGTVTCTRTVFSPALVVAQLCVQWVLVYRGKAARDHLPPCTARMKNVWRYARTPAIFFHAS